MFLIIVLILLTDSIKVLKLASMTVYRNVIGFKIILMVDLLVVLVLAPSLLPRCLATAIVFQPRGHQVSSFSVQSTHDVGVKRIAEF